MKYSEVIESIALNLVGRFSEVYHSADIITISEGGKTVKFPAISKDSEWINLSPSDQQETVYIRRASDDDVIDELKLTSCGHEYKMRSLLRVVYFNDNSDNSNESLFKLMQSVLTQGIKLKSIVRDKFKLLKDESSGDYNFGPKAAYFAIDIYALWQLTSDTCEQDFCSTIDNPIKK